MKHNGNSNFIVHMLNDQGKTEEYLANEIGDYDGSVVIGTTKAGYYLLDIDADGPWTVDIDQPRPTTAQQVPISMSGTGPQASEFFYLKQGLTTFKLNHNGESNFIVHLVDSKGNTEEYLVNEIGEFDGSKAIGVSKSGVYLISVDADGDWTISVK
ncbi:hypothetical protein [Methanocella sp. MCL-LM]|uniref:hypothetical protein n=1 Tax=Methanocella sp. MCL-LM TaxID=3412035 RepID=UPI003C74C1CF